MTFILRDMVGGGLLGDPFTGTVVWHGTNDRCEMVTVHGLEYRTGETVLQKVYQIIDQESGDGPLITIGEPTYDAENDRVTRSLTHSHPVLDEVDAIKAIKEEARRRIVAVYPEWQQSNMTARGVELVRIIAEGNQWDEAEALEAAALDAVWVWIKSIRAASNTIEADAGTLTQEQIETDVRWP